MVNYSKVRFASPFVCFFFARLGAFLELSSGRRLKVRLFVATIVLSSHS